MTKKLIISITLILCIVFAAAEVRVTPKQLIFKSSQPLDVRGDRTGLSAFDSYLNRLGAFNIRSIKGMHLPNYYIVNLTSDPDWNALRRGSLSFPGIAYVQPNYLNQMHIEPNDALFPQQYHYVISNPAAWNYTTGSSLVLVGIVDSGVLINHPDLHDNMWINQDEIPDDGIDNDNNGYVDDWCGWDFSDAPELADTAVGDFIGQDNDVEDENFHGTHVAGIVGAVGNNGIGVTGVAWNVSMIPIRAGFRTTAGQGFLQDDDAAAAVIYAVDNGCQIINMSWGDPEYSPIIGDACDYAYARGVTLVASAGNDPGPFLSYPAKLSNVISVGAINRNRSIAGFSSYGIDMDIVAPGELVLSTYKVDEDLLYFEQSGTSMSSPFVAGAAALLLSLHPGLSPAEVRARLLTSTDDLGSPGIDQYYGHGLLNTRKLLENTDPPIVYIDQPIEQSGITDDIDITGTVTGTDFFRYTVTYSCAEVPTILDWYDVDNHQNYPNFHMSPVMNGILAHFKIPEMFPEGNYTIRIQYENTSGGKYNYYRQIKYDRSAPVMRQQSLAGFRRYSGQNLRYYISAVFSEPVRTELDIIASNAQIYTCYGTQLDTLHIWTIPPTLPEGDINIQIKATNTSGLTFTSQNYNGFMTIQYELIPSYGYTWQSIGTARVPLNYTYDYNGDSYPEYVAMDLPSTGYGSVNAYQPSASGHVITYSYDDSFWLLGAGDTNGGGQELLQLHSDTARILETQAAHNYPELALWEDTSITGGTIVDYSNDGVQDLLLVKNLPTERVIQAYKRSGITFSPKNTLHNTSQTNVRNTFVPTIIVKNLDNDNYNDILTADTDGDIMIYEIHNDNLAELSWAHRMPIGNTYNIACGDFDGNNSLDFFIGGYYRDNLDPNLNFWYFEGFRNVANNSYASLGSIMFNNVTSQNAIQAVDLDNDNKDEIILAISPNLYILKYENGGFKPKFYGNSYRTYSILSYSDTNQRKYFLTNYSADQDSVFAAEWTSADPYTGPATPVNFLASAQDESTIKLSWLPSNAAYYVLYRKDQDDHITMIDHITGTSYFDTGLDEGRTYSYSIASFNGLYSPPESTPTIWQSATPFHVPILQRVEMVSQNQVRLLFDQPMSSSITNPNLYSVDNGMGSPTSVNSTTNQHGVQLHFSKVFPAITGNFILTLNNITGASGILFQDNETEFAYQTDTEAPHVTGVTIQPDKKSFYLNFNESLRAYDPNPELLGNYSLICPSNDIDNSISSIVFDDTRVLINLQSELKYASASYSITVNNVRDLAGNIISPQNNLARFSLSDINDLSKVTVFPNPVRTEHQLWCSFINFPANKRGRMKIYDGTGLLVLDTNIGPFNPDVSNISWHWDLKNNNARRVSSGVYFYVIEMDGDIARGKIAIIN
jgi:subtilisin family serine protease